MKNLIRLGLFVLLLCFSVFSCKHKEQTDERHTHRPSVVPETPIYDHLTEIAVFAGRNKGVEEKQEFEGDVITSILKGETKTIEVLGIVAYVYFLSEKAVFQSVTVNNVGLKINYDVDPKIKSVAGYVANLSDVEEVVLDVKIIAEGKTSKGKLKLVRKKALSDVPELALFMNGRAIARLGDTLIENLSSDEGIVVEDILENDGSVNICIASLLPFIKEVKIDGVSITPVAKMIGTNRYSSVAERKVVLTETKEFIAEIIPNRSDLFQNVKWKFKIKK